MVYEQEITIRFHEADAAGVVFFARYFELAHSLLENFVRHAGISYEEWFGLTKWIVPIVHAEADYLRSLQPGQTYKALVQVKSIGESSLSMIYKYEQNGKLFAKLELTHAFVDAEKRRKIEIPNHIRMKLEQFQ